jgi:RecB family exonuclease
MDELASLFARQRGTAALSYSIESVTDGSPRAPSPALLGAFRVAMGAPQARPAELLDQAGPPASFAPAKAGEALHGGEWRLARIKDGVGAEEVEADYPLIAQGRLAEERRAAAAFTEYDGYAPASASSEQLTAPGGPIVSAHRLETLGACPRRYFYRYVLGLQPFEDIEADPAGWLDAREAGALIHETFRAFMAAAQPQGGPMGEGSHWPLMRRIIDEQVERKRRQLPPRTAGAVERHRRLVEDAARMFLAEEARRPAGIVPRYFEASVGMTSEEQTPLDATAPAEVKVAGGLLRLRGRIDRVDELQGRERPEFRLIDYKTGGTSRYKGIHKDPFLEGRLIQHALYIRLAEPRLKTLHGAEAQVRRFSYYFPGERGAGRVLTWTPAQLNEGRHVIEKLCAIVEAGAYGPTENEKDCAYCDYASVCGDPRVISGQGATMMAHEANTALAHLAALRERSNRKT